MQEYQERVVKEQEDLSDKINKLQKFINLSDQYKGLHTQEQIRLYHQLLVMRQYSNILCDRIDNFK